MFKYRDAFKLIVLVIVTFFYNICYGQYTELKISRTITVSQFILELQNRDVDKINLRDLKIVPDEQTDTRYLLGATKGSSRLNWDSILQTYPPIIIDKEVSLINIYFAQRIIFPKIVFKQFLHIEDVDVYGDLTFRNCTFEQSINFVKFDSYFLDFIDCKFDRIPNFESVPTEQTTFLKCVFSEGINCYQNDEPLNLVFKDNKVFGSCAFVSAGGKGEVLIINTSFKAQKNQNEYVMIGGGFGAIDRLIMVSDTFEIPLNFAGAKISNNFILADCALHHSNYFENIVIPESSTKMRWNLIKNYKLGVSTDDNVFNGKSIISDATIDSYFDLIKVYSQVLRTYKNNGDQESYNACYIEMKDIQTQKAMYNFNNSPSVGSFFELVLNKFLKIFCDYGTNPVKAILMSFYVMIVFGLLYFLFPSDGAQFRFISFWKAIWNKSHRPSLKGHTYKAAKQMLNAFALSMNAFVTLGYGDMPAKGVARYLAVLEGLTGWFLLSIFSSSLISQILQ